MELNPQPLAQESGIITRSTSTILSSVSSTDPTLSDHLAVLFSITVSPHLKSNRITKVILNYRKINLTSFSNDILSSALFTSPPPTSLQSYLHLFNSTLLSVLCKHAPLKTITCPLYPNKPF